MTVEDVIEGIGVALVVAGAAMLSVPAALIVVGLVIVLVVEARS